MYYLKLEKNCASLCTLNGINGEPFSVAAAWCAGSDHGQYEGCVKKIHQSHHF
jgi:hypothetical protein